ncbi:hypothetical protein [Brevibacterium sp.]|uniref:hypothetical protein n=1 Tax=Brevibacterium sp. TaxID=1701 RepID=UPI0025C4D34E|nr:hypothetical protein [Brevibacterium sp.]
MHAAEQKGPGMKSAHLAPAVLASVAAAGLVLAPVAASAQEVPSTSAATEAETSAPASTEQQSGSGEAPAEEKPAAPEAPAEQPSEAPSAENGSEEESEAGSGTGEDSTGGNDDSGAGDTDAPEPPAEDPTGESEPEEEAEEEAPADPQLAVDDVAFEDVAQTDDGAVPGATITVTDLPAGAAAVTVSGGPEGAEALEVTATPDADADTQTATASYSFALPADADPADYAGTRTVSVTVEGEEVVTGSFEVLPAQDEAPEAEGTDGGEDGEQDASPEDDPQREDPQQDDPDQQQEDPALSVPGSISVDDIAVPQGEEPASGGLLLSATGLTPGETYTFRIQAPEGLEELDHSIEVTADEDGAASASYYIQYFGDIDLDILLGTYTVDLLGAEEEVLASSSFTVTGSEDDGNGGEDEDGSDEGSDEDGSGDDGKDDDAPVPGEDEGNDGQDEAPASAEISVSPRTITAADFTDVDKGVQVTASGCAPGEDVYLDVFWPGTGEVAYSSTDTADEDGVAGFSFYGTGTDLAAYVGTWKAEVGCGGTSASTTFTVTGGQGTGGQDGSRLPRTGTDSSALAVGAAALLAVGSAAVMISTRRQIARED